MNIQRLSGPLLVFLVVATLTACDAPSEAASPEPDVAETTAPSATPTATVIEMTPLFWEYEIQLDDTPEDIAARFGVSVETVIFNNIDMTPTGESNSFVQILVPGTIAIVPTVDGILHSVSDGDTVASIAERYDADERDILEFRANGLDGDADNLEAGSLILVPVGRNFLPRRGQRQRRPRQRQAIVGRGRSRVN